MTLLRLWLALLGTQLRISQAECEHNQRYAKADTRDCQQSLHMLITIDNRSPLVRSNRIFSNKQERTSVEASGQSLVSGESQSVLELRVEGLRPDGARDAVAECGANVVTCEVDTGDDGNMFVLCCGLDGSLCWVWEKTSCDTQENLGADNTGLSGVVVTTSVVDKKAKRNQEEHRSGQDEVFEASDLEDDERNQDTGDD